MARKFYVPIDLVQNELQNARVHNLASAPGSPVEGQIYEDTTTHRMYVWSGSAWIMKATDSDLLGGQTLAQVRDFSQTTGTRTNTAISDFDTQVRLSRLDQMAAPTADLSINSHKLTNVSTPTAAGDAATKGYVDGVAQGLDFKASVKMASTANISGTYTATGGSSGRGQLTAMPNTAVDGVALVANDRVLLKDQTTGAQNGIWVVTTVGTGANGVWDRATDFDTDAEVTTGAFTFVEQGTVNGDTGWVLTTDNPIIIGGASGTALAFAQFSASGTITAGAGLLKTGNTIDAVAGTTPATSAGPGGGLKMNADDIVIDATIVARKYTAQLTGSTTSYTVNHALANQWVTCQVVRNSTPWDVIECDIEMTDANNVTVRFAAAPASNAYRAIVVG